MSSHMIEHGFRRPPYLAIAFHKIDFAEILDFGISDLVGITVTVLEFQQI
uniref:Uncharacterized protein n=1 Tax=Rhizophagus irregularis (strain DAOM 181602 / DAOM 197198 / MUCL 43194) TaxID=747089 RepID=U9U196_RHIID